VKLCCGSALHTAGYCRCQDFEEEEEESRLRVLIFGPKLKEVAGDWRKLHNEELYNLYS
jgi:hypothetical protein